ncbi:hypothetical protein HUK80_10750 [Flavobacterium sp. MAH-1]|jgi:predicted hotdog family 3-hydroxylacyl-ACP dehydratase|uniref:3-hydroxymyristoyl/3-hydroxydecanoyl-(Acyl carrier protein) dehydratase n=1 Tax=Flavobacterium agri TaxID=2743471 RepID=A0A7Y9C5K8_9FLAO|nr:hypothetical protein [Flavobacterium agri]NUY81377.1 hypothetical protein [Flavobacterium agri]NYA71401.1 hypothetical protein [Flavobacterium agri]
MEVLAEKEAVGQLIPQKFPFVMVDKLFSFTESQVESGLLVSDDNIFTIEGTFRESGLIEHMAQSVALHTGYKFFLKQEPAPTGYIGSVSSLQISQLPKTGDEIRTSVNIIQEFGDITMVEITSFVNGSEIAKGQMKTVLAK